MYLNRDKHVSVQATKTYGALEIHIHAFLMPTLNGDEWSALSPGHFTTGETAQIKPLLSSG
jgi:hypothetical protein